MDHDQRALTPEQDVRSCLTAVLHGRGFDLAPEAQGARHLYTGIATYWRRLNETADLALGKLRRLEASAFHAHFASTPAAL